MNESKNPGTQNQSRLPVDNLGSFVRGRTFYQQPDKGNAVVGPSSQGDGWSAYILYKDHIVRRDPWTIIEIDLQTEKVISRHGTMADCWFLTLMPDGCIYTFPEDTDCNPHQGYIARINPGKGDLEIFGPGSPDSWNYSFCWGADNAIYVGGWRKHHAVKFDPATTALTDFGPQGPDVTGGLYYIAADEEYIYSTLGGQPYLLNSFHKTTGHQEVIAQWDRPQRAVLLQRPDGIFAVVDVQPKSLLDTELTHEIVQVYRLENKQLTPIDTLPPGPDILPGVSPGGITKPRILETSPVCRGDGTATLWYQPGEEDWRSVTFEAGTSPSYLFRLGTFQDKIIGASEDPYNLFTYDSSDGTKSLLGGLSLHTYAFQEYEGKVYFAGYSGGSIYEWDPEKPWTLLPPSPSDSQSSSEDSTEANPRVVARYDLQRRSYNIVLAADRRLYVPKSAYIESIPGGLLAWYDPTTGKSGGIRDPFEFYAGMDAATACDGRFVIVATKPWPDITDRHPEADLVIYDTKEKSVSARVVPKKGCPELSTIIEWEPGKIIGRFVETPDDKGSRTTFYLLNVEHRSCRTICTVSGAAGHRMIRAPQGKIACLFGPTLALLDPADESLEIAGHYELAPRDWTLLKDDLYLIMEEDIRVVKGFADGLPSLYGNESRKPAHPS